MKVKATDTAPKSFRKQFIELFSGSASAQLFSLCLMPVISRIYSPAQMGEYALYVSIMSIASVLSTFRLDAAVVLTESDEEASCLAYTGSLSAMIGALLVAIGLSLYGFPPAFSLMTAASVATFGTVQCLMTWHSRKRHYRILAARNAVEKLIVLAAGIGLGFWGYTHYGLILAQALGFVFSFSYLGLVSGMPGIRTSFANWTQKIRKYSDFPRTNVPATTLNVTTLFLPTILFATYFAKAELGNYNLVSRLFEVPINLVAYTFSTVYYQHSSRIAPSERLRLYWRTLRWLSIIFLPGLAIVAMFGPGLMSTLFGEVWRESGVLSVWLAPLTALRLLYTAQSPTLLVRRKLKLDFVMSGVLCAAQIGGFFIGLFMFHSVLGCVKTMSILGIIVYALGLVVIRQVLADGVAESTAPSPTVLEPRTEVSV